MTKCGVNNAPKLCCFMSFLLPKMHCWKHSYFIPIERLRLQELIFRSGYDEDTNRLELKGVFLRLTEILASYDFRYPLSVKTWSRSGTFTHSITNLLKTVISARTKMTLYQFRPVRLQKTRMTKNAKKCQKQSKPSLRGEVGLITACVICRLLWNICRNLWTVGTEIKS